MFVGWGVSVLQLRRGIPLPMFVGENASSRMTCATCRFAISIYIKKIGKNVAQCMGMTAYWSEVAALLLMRPSPSMSQCRTLGFLLTTASTISCTTASQSPQWLPRWQRGLMVSQCSRLLLWSAGATDKWKHLLLLLYFRVWAKSVLTIKKE